MSYVVNAEIAGETIGIGFDKYHRPALNNDAVQFVRESDAEQWMAYAGEYLSGSPMLVVKKTTATRKKKPKA